MRDWWQALVNSGQIVAVTKAAVLVVVGLIVARLVSRLAARVATDRLEPQQVLLLRRAVSYGLTVLFLVDLSASGAFGSRAQTKNEVAAELCALLAFSAIRNNDKVGLIVFTDRIERFIPPKKGATHVLRLIRELLHFQPKGRGTDIAQALDYVGRIAHRKAIVFLVSDFLDDDYDRPFRIVARRHDLVAVSVDDPREKTLPDVGLIELEDAETGERIVVDTSSKQVRTRFAASARRRAETRSEVFRSTSVDEIQVTAGEDYVRDLMLFFRKRESRL